MKYDSVTEIDVHGMRAEESVKALGWINKEASEHVCRIRVIHGCRISDRVLRTEGGNNPGITGNERGIG